MAFPVDDHLPYWLLHFTTLMILMLLGSRISANGAPSPRTMVTAPNTTLPKCERTCGNLTVPYPFGIGSGCSLNPVYEIYCNKSHNPPKAQMSHGGSHIEIVDIDERYLRMKNVHMAIKCIRPNLTLTSDHVSVTDLTSFPFSLSDSMNVFVAIGCHTLALISGTRCRNANFTSGCVSICSRKQDLMNGSCSGVGCCQTQIPKGLKIFTASLSSLRTDQTFVVSTFKHCGYAFLAEKNHFIFRGAEDLFDPDFKKRVGRTVRVVLDWDVGNGTKCHEAKRISNTYACKGNTTCIDSDNTTASGGYRCTCLPGYEGNPYLPPGCTDIDECSTGSNNHCSHICTNVPGSYECDCPKRYHGDGFRNGTRCVLHKSELAMKAGLGTSIGLSFTLIIISILYFNTKRRRIKRMREKFFCQNGGYLLRQQLSLIHGGIESSKIFTVDELKLATNNYSEDRIIGRGGYGIAYKGVLSNNLVVAIKKSKVVDESQIEQFINEVVILTQINHRNVVKLFGCCLETQVPLLVYQFISNGTLSEHMRNGIRAYWLTWANCVRIASEVATAISYLHSAASPPIIHRDIKSANILIDDAYSAKVSDFGASRLVPLDHQTQITTLVRGTLGYLDPEYLHNSRLTEKSDVYSFGVVLAELLTRMKPFSNFRKTEDRNLAAYFITAIKDNFLLEIVHPQLLKEADREQLIYLAMLVKKCLSCKGEDRPTMKEIASELEGLKESLKHPWVNSSDQNSSEGGQSDLYPVPSSTDLIRHNSK